MFEVRGGITGTEGGLEIRGGNTVANLFYGSDGWMSVDGAGFQVYKGKEEKSWTRLEGPRRRNPCRTWKTS